MDELHSCMLILLSGIMAQVQSLSLTVTKGRLKTSYIREDGTIFIHLSASLLKHSSITRRRSLCQQMWMVSDELVKAAVKKSLQHTTTLIGEDTDLLVLRLYYAQDVNKGLYFRSDKSKSHGNFTVYDINRLKEFLGQDICSQLLFIHAVTGCDSTSRIFGVGKRMLSRNF